MTIEYKKKLHVHKNALMPIITLYADDISSGDADQPGFILETVNLSDKMRQWTYRMWYGMPFDKSYAVLSDPGSNVNSFGYLLNTNPDDQYALLLSIDSLDPAEIAGYVEQIDASRLLTFSNNLGLPNPLVPKFRIDNFGFPVSPYFYASPMGIVTADCVPTNILEKYVTCQDIKITKFNACEALGVPDTLDWAVFLENELLPFVSARGDTYYIAGADPLNKIQPEAGRIWNGSTVEFPFGMVGVPEEYLEAYENLRDSGYDEYNEYLQAFMEGNGVLFLDNYQRHFDYVFEIPCLQPEPEISTTTAPYFKLAGDYSFYNPLYEDALQLFSPTLEPLLPNMYLIDAASQGEMAYFGLLTLFGTIPGYTAGSEAFKAAMASFLWSSNLEGSYLKLYADAIKKILGDPVSKAAAYALSLQYRDLILSSTQVDDYARIATDGTAAPLFAEIQFATKYNVGSNGFEFAGALDQNLEPPATTLVQDVLVTAGLSSDFWEAEVGLSADVVASPLEHSPDDFYGSVRNVWNIHEWFNWYCVPQEPPCAREPIIMSELLPVATVEDTDPARDDPAAPESGPTLGTSPDGGWNLTEDLDEIIQDQNVGGDIFEVNPPFGGVIAGFVAGAPDIVEGTEPCQPSVQYLSDTEVAPAEDTGTGTFIVEELPLPPMIAAQYGEEIDCEAEGISTISAALASVYEKLDDLVLANLRSYSDVVSGVPAYSEPVFYRVEKKAITGDEGEKVIVQNIFLPISQETDVMQYIDTQVGYNQEYEYRIFGYQLVIGNEYWYAGQTFTPLACESGFDPDTGEALLDTSGLDPLLAVPPPPEVIAFVAGEEVIPPEGEFWEVSDDAYVRVCQRPHIVLVETEYTAKEADLTVKMIENPPVYPEVQIIPYRGVNDRILINLQGNLGSYRDKPIIISPADELNFIESATQQGIYEAGMDIRDVEIEFEADDYPVLFEIYRTTVAPRTYEDFFNVGTKKVLSNVVGTEQIFTSNSTIELIKPNTKYWYVFRNVDSHGHISNPTPIYQVEMVDDGNSIYPLIQFYVLPSARKGKLETSFRKYLNIQASDIQLGLADIISAQEFVDTGAVLGANATESIWGGKKFKIRVTSKHSGKQIDVNVRFKKSATDTSRYDPDLVLSVPANPETAEFDLGTFE